MRAASLGDERLPIVPASVLLADQGEVLARVRLLSACSPVQFEAVYAPLLTAFTEYVQRVPCPVQPTQTILQVRLQAAERALARRRGVILPLDVGPEQVAREADLWTYVVFSGALLRRLADEFSPWAITVWSADERPLGRWRPQATPRGLARMRHAAWYRVRRVTEPPSADWTPLMVGALLPDTALNWLWREPRIMGVWQQLLHNHPLPEIDPLFMT